MFSGAGVTVTHVADGDTRRIQLGLQTVANEYSEDGMPIGFLAIALKHIVAFLRSVLPSTVTIASQFPTWSKNSGTEIAGEIKVPFVAIKVMLGPSEEIGVGGMMWEDSDGVVKGFNQTAYIDFSIWDRTPLKTDQLTAQILLQLEKEKRSSGELYNKGFQQFHSVRSEPTKGFVYGYIWDFRLQQQFADLFHHKLVIRTKFDVVWRDNSEHAGIISQIVFGSTGDIPVSMVIGSSLAYLLLEAKYHGWHSNAVF